METVEYLTSLPSIRQRCSLLLSNPQNLTIFDLDLTKIDDCKAMVLNLIKRDYKTINDIPPHSRWRHFDAGKQRIAPLMDSWSGIDKMEQVRRYTFLTQTA
jgi:Protein of unknown function (DUF1688)